MSVCVSLPQFASLPLGSWKVGKGRVAALVPFVRHPQKDYFELLDVSELYEPTDVLCSDTTALPLLAETIVGQGVPFLLQSLPADSRFIAPLKQALTGRGLIVCRRDLGSPVIALDSRWADPESQLNSGRRSDLRRARRRAEALGPVSVEVLSPEPADLPTLLEDAFGIEAASWKGARGSALAMDPMRGAFYRQYAEAACCQGSLRLAFLKIGTQRIAMQLEVEIANRVWLLKIGYNERFARCSPGMLLLTDTVRDAARRGLESFEFLGTPEDWTRVWTQVERPCLALHGYPFGLGSLSAFADRLVKSAWARVSHAS